MDVVLSPDFYCFFLIYVVACLALRNMSPIMYWPSRDELQSKHILANKVIYRILMGGVYAIQNSVVML